MRWASSLGVPMARTVTNREQAGDIPMMDEAGVGIAFAVRERVSVQLSIA